MPKSHKDYQRVESFKTNSDFEAGVDMILV